MGESKVRGGKTPLGRGGKRKPESDWGFDWGEKIRYDSAWVTTVTGWYTDGYDYANLFLSKLERFSCDSDSCSVSLYSLYTLASQPVYASYVYRNFLRRSDR